MGAWSRMVEGGGGGLDIISVGDQWEVALREAGGGGIRVGATTPSRYGGEVEEEEIMGAWSRMVKSEEHTS